MKKLFLAGFGTLAVLAFCHAEASALWWNVCGQKSCTYQVSGPRVVFGIECGPQCCPKVVPGPAVQAPCNAAPAKTEAPIVEPTQPASYRPAAPRASSPSVYNSYSSGTYAVPSYWYGR